MARAKTRFGRLLCRIGLHKWRTIPITNWHGVVRECARCRETKY